jgi:hypothetical protein
MDKELIKKIAIYGGIGIGSLVVIGITAAAIRNKRFSGKGKGQGEGAGLGGGNETVGKTLKTNGASAYLRSTPEIPNNLAGQCSWYDVVCLGSQLAADTMVNAIGTIRGNAGGATIKKVVVGKDGYNWYYLEGVEVSNFGGVSVKKNGYVREDVVTVNYK